MKSIQLCQIVLLLKFGYKALLDSFGFRPLVFQKSHDRIHKIVGGNLIGLPFIFRAEVPAMNSSLEAGNADFHRGEKHGQVSHITGGCAMGSLRNPAFRHVTKNLAPHQLRKSRILLQGKIARGILDFQVAIYGQSRSP